MRTIVPGPVPGRPELSPPGLRSAGLWSVRLAGAGSASPAIELYAAGVLIDVVSATAVAPQLLRGARAVTLGPVPCALFTRVDVQAGPRRAGRRLARGRSCR